MNKQQLAALADQLIEGMVIVGEHSPTLPPGPEEVAYDYVLSFGEGLFYLGITFLEGYYCYPATREQPKDEGWAKEREVDTDSPFLTDLIQILEDNSIPLPEALVL